MAPSGLDFNLRAFLKTYFIVVHYNGKEEPFGEDFSPKVKRKSNVFKYPDCQE